MKKLALAITCLCTSISANAIGVSGQGTWETTLQARDLDGNLATAEAYYDTVLNITWLADANFGAGSAYDDINFDGRGTTVDGAMTWASANAWAASLNPYGSGITGWRLPTVTDTGTPGCDKAYTSTDCGFNVNTATGEMAHMFYTTLGDKAWYSTSGVYQPSYDSNTGPFSNVLFDNGYWSAAEYAPHTIEAWAFFFIDGNQDYDDKIFNYYAWAVHDGDVGAKLTPPPTDVEIDIKPSNKTNPVNPRSKGKLKVAILTTKDFDASTVDVSTIQFGPGSAAPIWYRLDDVDNDGDWDLVLKFKTQDTDIACGDTEATLTGQMYDGVQITGTDTIKTVGCRCKSK